MLRRLLLVGMGFVACAGVGSCAAHGHHGPNVSRNSDTPVVDIKARYRQHDHHATGHSDDAPAHGNRGTVHGRSRSQSWTHARDDNSPDR